MNKSWLARSATRWWSQPVRFTANAVAAIYAARQAASRSGAATAATATCGRQVMSSSSPLGCSTSAVEHEQPAPVVRRVDAAPLHLDVVEAQASQRAHVFVVAASTFCTQTVFSRR